MKMIEEFTLLPTLKHFMTCQRQVRFNSLALDSLDSSPMGTRDKRVGMRIKLDQMRRSS